MREGIEFLVKTKQHRNQDNSTFRFRTTLILVSYTKLILVMDPNYGVKGETAYKYNLTVTSLSIIILHNCFILVKAMG